MRLRSHGLADAERADAYLLASGREVARGGCAPRPERSRVEVACAGRQGSGKRSLVSHPCRRENRNRRPLTPRRMWKRRRPRWRRTPTPCAGSLARRESLVRDASDALRVAAAAEARPAAARPRQKTRRRTPWSAAANERARGVARARREGGRRPSRGRRGGARARPRDRGARLNASRWPRRTATLVGRR